MILALGNTSDVPSRCFGDSSRFIKYSNHNSIPRFEPSTRVLCLAFNITLQDDVDGFTGPLDFIIHEEEDEV